jgi:hypothetical protein
LVDVSEQADAAASFQIQVLSANGQVYLKNSGSATLVVSSVVIGGNPCTIGSGIDLNISGSSSGNISVSGCTIVAGSAYNILIATNNGVITEKLIAID